MADRKAATAECYDCHYIFEKPGMIAGTAQSSSRTYFGPTGGRRGSSVGHKTVWRCSACNSIHKAKQRRTVSWIIGGLVAFFGGLALLIQITEYFGRHS